MGSLLVDILKDQLFKKKKKKNCQTDLGCNGNINSYFTLNVTLLLTLP